MTLISFVNLFSARVILKGPNELMYLELFLLACRVLYRFKRLYLHLKIRIKVNCKIELVAIRVVTAEGLIEKAERNSIQYFTSCTIRVVLYNTALYQAMRLDTEYYLYSVYSGCLGSSLLLRGFQLCEPGRSSAVAHRFPIAVAFLLQSNSRACGLGTCSLWGL